VTIEIRHRDGWRDVPGATLRGTLSPDVHRLYMASDALGGEVVYQGTQVGVRVDGTEALAASELTELRGRTMVVLMVVMPRRHRAQSAASRG